MVEEEQKVDHDDDDEDDISALDRTLIQFAQTEEGSEQINKFKGRVSIKGLYKRGIEILEAIEHAQGSYDDMLRGQLYSNYYMLCTGLGTNE